MQILYFAYDIGVITKTIQIIQIRLSYQVIAIFENRHIKVFLDLPQ